MNLHVIFFVHLINLVNFILFLLIFLVFSLILMIISIFIHLIYVIVIFGVIVLCLVHEVICLILIMYRVRLRLIGDCDLKRIVYHVNGKF